ncbi:hypothetical protein ONS95_000856 [Cadophora gregata]|uniref:uncharacterized protein n=1 Tax=Cadophora gregata TaxID=51156 RepID=UPI0026DB6A9E|nr:uncharacterized protein ONS95_000856 [Cadophora gregata]KAK0102950.1 hypothetical protein ONS96_005573 [Cadophora gregata f. sp. sojae]KAK0128911.1 hypothetical protein ONS95_000856 [Cadophora gregata]
MDYDSIHGPGQSNFSSPIAHRMPTVSAAQALQDLKTSPTRCISTGLELLDCMLQNRELVFSDLEALPGGISRGKVTEIYGPPGVGKTALGMQLAASVLHAGEGVVWIDASHLISGSRFSQILTSHDSHQPAPATSPHSNPATLTSLLSNFTHFSTPSLAHLLAFLTQPTTLHPPPNTSLIVIDSFSTLIANAFPRSVDSTGTSRKPGAPNPSARKFPILQHLISSLSKLATTRNIAIVVTSQCVTKMRPGAGAVLVPAVNATAWEQGLGCRVELMRDWGWEDEEGGMVDGVRLVRVLKAEGVAVGGTKLVGFAIRDTGLHSLSLPLIVLPTQSLPQKHQQSFTTNTNTPHTAPIQNTLPQKRKLSATDLEIPDSDAEDDEDYGWAEEDEEELPPPPPQWQGSEDALAPPIEENEGDEELLELGMGMGDGEDGDDIGEDAEGRGRMIEKDVIDDSEDELAL